ncbi:uncharacterized protein [Montipora capricornis]|uniref:uncharacterized protein n=1 Tax=Montipora capricornis TaxID=246305 RepID=UPI0035F11497
MTPSGLPLQLPCTKNQQSRDAQCAWDEKLPEELEIRYQKWEQNLPRLLDVPRALVIAGEQIEEISLHAFGETSARGVAAVVYAVVNQGSCFTQGLAAARSRLAKQGLTIPRLELVSGHMALNFIKNVSDALVGLPVTSMTAWQDSSVALHWILKGGDFKQFVGNRIRKIKEHEAVEWRHVPSGENPADLASRGGLVTKENTLWWKGPIWLSDPLQ